MRSPISAPARDRAPWILAALLGAGTLLLYARVAHHPFIEYDDFLYVTENPVVQRGLTWSGVAWAFTTLHASNWHPLTWLSHMLDVQLFGVAPGAHHVVNAMLHAANAALLCGVLARMTGAPARSAVVAALFAVHPLHVESVAWVSERKDLVSTLFGLLMLGAYARYARRPGAGRYALVAACLALSLLAKPMWVTAPFLLLLFDAWPLQRFRRSPLPVDPRSPRAPPRGLGMLLLEKLPLLTLSAASSAVTVVAQDRSGALRGLELGLGPRIANAIVSYARYLEKALWPSSLAVIYPFEKHLPAWRVAGAAVLLAAVTALALKLARRSPAIAVGWCWFLGTLVPVIGLVQVGGQAMADRYAYVPLIGLFVAVVWSLDWLTERWRAGLPLRAGTATCIAALAALAWVQIGHWSSHEALFRHAIAVTGENGPANRLLAQGLVARGRFAEALVPAREALRLEPTSPRAHKNLGYVLYRLGLVDDAIDEFRAAIALKPDYAEAHGNLGLAYGKKGLVREAMDEMAAELALRSAAAAR